MLENKVEDEAVAVAQVEVMFGLGFELGLEIGGSGPALQKQHEE